MDEAEVIERVALVADDEASEIAQPREEPFNLPSPLVATQGAPSWVLGRLRLRRWGAIISMPNAASPASKGSAS